MKTTRPQETKRAADPRRAALDILLAVTTEGRLMSEVEADAVSDLGQGDAARARRLAAETLRWAGRADRMIGRHLRQRPPEDVLNALRLGAFEIHVAGEAPHGVVSSLVSLVRDRSKEPGLGRLANAVLRKIAAAEDWANLALPQLPKPIRKRLIGQYGKARVCAMEGVHARIPPLDVTPRNDPAAVALETGGSVLPTGSVRLEVKGQVSAIAGFERGDWWVQDAASALPARLLGVRPGDRVLDLCAAPGGKTLQLAALGADVTAVDISENRLRRLRENLARTAMTATVVVADALDWSDVTCDRVLLDAPCSATGTIRRHPDLPFAKRDLDLGPLVALQARLVDRAAEMLLPGGTLVYCTCSLYAEEGEAQIESALMRHPGLRIDPISPTELAGLDPTWIDDRGMVRITPETWADRGGIDGFFIARLRYAETANRGDDRAARTG